MDKLEFIFIYTILNTSLFFDWAAQTNWEATNKFKMPLARLIHALIYSTLTALLLMSFGYKVANPGRFSVMWVWAILLLTHYIIDKRTLVTWWMKNIKRIPEDDLKPGPGGEWPVTWWLNIALDQWFHIMVNFIVAIIYSMLL